MTPNWQCILISIEEDQNCIRLQDPRLQITTQIQG